MNISHIVRIEVIATGRMRDKAQLALWQDYTKRMSWPLKLIEIEGKSREDESRRLLEKITADAFLVVMDERGKSVASRKFADMLVGAMRDGAGRVQFIIGGADGLDDRIRDKANFLLSFGAQTWPHMLARIMLAEQLYRAQQINAGHPYHRD